jgi:hypothetical protein
LRYLSREVRGAYSSMRSLPAVNTSRLSPEVMIRPCRGMAGSRQSQLDAKVYTAQAGVCSLWGKLQKLPATVAATAWAIHRHGCTCAADASQNYHTAP